MKEVKQEFSNIKKLFEACDEIAGVIADDVILLKEHGNDDEIDNRLQMLGSKKNKIYERYLQLVSNLKHFKAIEDLYSQDKGKTSSKDNKEPDEAINTPKAKKNIQDFVINKNV